MLRADDQSAPESTNPQRTEFTLLAANRPTRVALWRTLCHVVSHGNVFFHSVGHPASSARSDLPVSVIPGGAM